MTRTEFLDRLRKGLNGLPAATIDDIVADYDTHFSDALAAGRSEADVASALGDPQRLARELRAEAGIKIWETAKTPSSALSAMAALLGLGALDILILIPILGSVVTTLICTFLTAFVVIVVGGGMFVIGPFLGFPGGIATMLLGGLGLMTGGVAIGALTIALTIWLINGVIWYARLHYRLLKPALDA